MSFTNTIDADAVRAQLVRPLNRDIRSRIRQMAQLIASLWGGPRRALPEEVARIRHHTLRRHRPAL